MLSAIPTFIVPLLSFRRPRGSGGPEPAPGLNRGAPAAALAALDSRFRGNDEGALLCVSVVKYLVLLGPQAVPGVRLTGGLDAHRVDRGARGEGNGPEIGTAKAQGGRDLGGADDAEPQAARCKHPGTARTGTIDAALGIGLHDVGRA